MGIAFHSTLLLTNNKGPSLILLKTTYTNKGAEVSQQDSHCLTISTRYKYISFLSDFPNTVNPRLADRIVLYVLVLALPLL